MAKVSVIVPCFNEEDSIQLLLDAIKRQSFKLEFIEVIIADGLSSDQTRQKIQDYQFRNQEMNIQLIDNPTRTIPAALNRAIASSTGEIIIRLDAHCIPFEDYIANCVNDLNQDLAESVGGIWIIKPGNSSWQANSISTATTNPLGVGDALYRFTQKAQYVDTVPFGAFFRSLINKIGVFDETLLSNEDYEFNARLRKSGGRIWLDPRIKSIYFSRVSYLELLRQYWRYGFWKARMIKKYPETIRWRQGLPPIFVLSLIMLPILAIWFPIVGYLFVIESLSYLFLLLLAGVHSAIKQGEWTLVLGVPLAIAVMHLTWGSAFLWSLISR